MITVGHTNEIRIKALFSKPLTLRNVKNYFVAKVEVFIGRKESVIITMYGEWFNASVVKRSAEQEVRLSYETRTFSSKILSKTDIDFEEYKKATGYKTP